MIDFTKTYKMMLTDDEGNVYKSDDARLMNADIHSVGPEELYAEIMVSAPRFMIEMNEAGTPPEMPLAAVAEKATKIIQEKKRKKAIEKEWTRLTEEVCKAVKAGDEAVKVDHIFKENEIRLIEMGYTVMKESYHWRIRWIDPTLPF